MGELPENHKAAIAALRQIDRDMGKPWDDPAAELEFVRRVASEIDEWIYRIMCIKGRAIRRYRETQSGIEATRTPLLTPKDLDALMPAGK